MNLDENQLGKEASLCDVSRPLTTESSLPTSQFPPRLKEIKSTSERETRECLSE